MILRRSRAPLLGALLAGIGLLAVPSEARAKPGVEDLEAVREASGVLVSYRVSGGLTAETLERIHSGIPVGFRHKVEVRVRRGALLPTKVVARVIVRTRVEYDSLTQRYHLFRRSETRSRQRKLEPPPVEEKRVTQSLEEMTDWMTRLERLTVDDPAREIPSAALRVRVEVSIGRRYVLWIFPSNVEATAERRLDADR